MPFRYSGKKIVLRKQERFVDMTVQEAIRQIKRRIDDLREEVAAGPVAPWLWQTPEVIQALSATANCLLASGFNGDWEGDWVDPDDDRVEVSLAELKQVLRNSTRLYSVPPSVWNRETTSPERSEKSGRAVSRPILEKNDIGGQMLSDYLSWHLRNDGVAQYFLENVCGGEYVSPAEAWEFLTASLPKVMSIEEYKQRGLIPIRTKGQLLSKYLQVDGLLFFTNMLMVNPKTGIPTATTKTLKSDYGQYCAEIILPDGSKDRQVFRRKEENNYLYVAVSHNVPQPYEVPVPDEGAYRAPLAAPYFNGNKFYVEGYGHSVMGELIGFASFFTAFYPVTIWAMLEALLTGQFPLTSAITVFDHSFSVVRYDGPDEIPDRLRREKTISAQGPVTLTVQPWVTPEGLADVWREWRKKIPTYSPSDKQAEIMRFVLAHTPPGEEFKWEHLARQWYTEHGERITRARLYDQFQRARAAILPGYEEGLE